MASEINTNELNRIQDDGRMPTESINEEDKKVLEEVEEGRRSTEELPQLIPPMRIIDEVQHNDIYKLIIGPCSAEGFNVNQKLLDLLKDQKIKPIELASVLDNTMQDIIKYVNQNDAYPIMFSDVGKINVEETVQKAQRTNRKVSRYVTSLAEDSGMKIEDLRTRETIFGLDIAMNRSKEEYDWLDKVFSPRLQEYDNKINEFIGKYAKDWNISENEDGSKTVDTKLSKRANIAINVLSNLGKFLVNSASDVGSRKQSVQDLLRLYEFLKDTDWINDIPEEERDNYLSMVEEAKRVVEDKCNLYYNKDISNEADYEEILTFLGVSRENLGTIRDCEVFKKIEKNLENLTLQDVNIDAFELREKDEIITMIRAFSCSLGSMNDFKSYNPDITNNIVIYNRTILARLEQAFPEYFREAMDRTRNDEYATIRLIALRELKAKELFEKRFNDPNHEPHKGSNMNLNDFQAIKIAAAVLKSKGYSKEIREMAMETIVRYLPEAPIDEKDQKEFINLDRPGLSEKLDKFIDTVQREAMYKTSIGRNPNSICSGEDFAYAGMHSLDMMARSTLTAEMVKKSRGEKIEFSVLNSEEYRELYDKKVKEVNEKIYDVKYLESLTKDINSTIRKIEAGEELSKSEEIAFVQKLVMTAKELQNNRIPELELVVKEYLVDYLPEVFERNDEFDIKFRHIDERLNEFLENKGLSPEEVTKYNEDVKKEMAEKTKIAVSKTKISEDIVATAEVNSRHLAAGLKKEKDLEHIEDQIRFVNYILRRKDILSPDKQKELEGYAESIIADRKNVHKYLFKSMENIVYDPLENHGEFDEKKVKTKFVYLEKEARKVVATERISETLERFKDNGPNSITEKEEIQGILGTYMGILNDYKNEELNVMDYKILIGKLTSLMKKVDSSLLNEDGIIDEDKALELYNKINGTDFEDIEDASKYEETELLMRYTRRLSKEVESHVAKSDSKYIRVIDDDNLYLKHKMQETTRKEVNINTRTTTELITEIWNGVRADADGSIDVGDKKLIATLALAEGAFGSKSLRKKGLSYEENLIQELESKTLTAVRLKLAEIFPDAFDKETGNVDRTRLTMLIQDYFEKNDPEIVDRLDNGETIFEALKNQREEYSNLVHGPKAKLKTPAQLLAEAKEFLKGDEKDKSFDDHVMVGRMIVGMADRFGRSGMKKRLLNRLAKGMSEEEKKRFIESSESERLNPKTENAIRRLGGIRAVEEFEKKYGLYGKEKMSTVLEPEERAKYLLVAAGAAMACNELPSDGVNQDAKELITKYMKRLAPRTVNSNNEINFDRVRAEINNCYKSSDLAILKTVHLDKEQFRQNALRKIDTRVALDLYENKIDSRFTNRYYIPNPDEKSRILSTSEIEIMISKYDMDKIMGTRGEEIVVDPEATRAPVEDKKKEEDVVISGEEFDSMFAENAVELGGEDSKKVVEPVPEVAEVAAPKVEQQVVTPTTGVHTETVHVADESWKENLPVEQKQRGFLGNLFDKFKQGIIYVKEKIFGVAENNTTGTGATDNNTTTSTTSGTGGVNKDEQNVEALTGHGKIKLEFGTPATQTAGTESKGKDPKSGGETEHDEEVL